MGAKGSKPGVPTPVAGATPPANAPRNITQRSTWQTAKNAVKGRVMGTGTTGDARAQLSRAVSSGNGNLVDPGVLRAAIQSGANIEGIINTPLIAPYRTFDFARKLTRVDVFKLLFGGKEFKQAVIDVNKVDGSEKTYLVNVLSDLIDVLTKVMTPKKSFTGSVIQNPDCKPVDPAIVKMVALKLAYLLQNPGLNNETMEDFATYLSETFSLLANQVAADPCTQYRDDALKLLIKSLNELTDGSEVYNKFLDQIKNNEFIKNNLSDWESKTTNVKNLAANTGIRNVNRGQTKKTGYLWGTTAGPINKEFDKLRKERVWTWKEFEKLDTNVLGVPGDAQKLNNVAVKDIYNVHEVLTLLGRKTYNRHQDCNEEDWLNQVAYEMELFEYIVTHTPGEVANKPLGMMQSNKTPLLYLVSTTLNTLREPCATTDDQKTMLNQVILSTFAKKLFLMITNGFIYSVKDSKGMGILEYLTDFVTSTNPKDCNPKLVVKVFNELVKMDRQSQNPTFKNFVKELRARFGNSLRSNVNWNGKRNAKIDNVISLAPEATAPAPTAPAPTAPAPEATVPAPTASANNKSKLNTAMAPAPTSLAKLANDKSKLNAAMAVAPKNAKQAATAAATATQEAGAPEQAVVAAANAATTAVANGAGAQEVAEKVETAVKTNGGSTQAAIQAGNAAGAVTAVNSNTSSNVNKFTKLSLNEESNKIGKLEKGENNKPATAAAAGRTRRRFRYRLRQTRSW